MLTDADNLTPKASWLTLWGKKVPCRTLAYVPRISLRSLPKQRTLKGLFLRLHRKKQPVIGFIFCLMHRMVKSENILPQRAFEVIFWVFMTAWRLHGSEAEHGFEDSYGQVLCRERRLFLPAMNRIILQDNQGCNFIREIHRHNAKLSWSAVKSQIWHQYRIKTVSAYRIDESRLSALRTFCVSGKQSLTLQSSLESVYTGNLRPKSNSVFSGKRNSCKKTNESY